MCACMCACACTWEHISRKCVIYPNEHWNLPYKQCLPLQIVIWSCGTARSENLKVPLKKHDKDLPNNHYRNEQEINRTYICTTSSSASQTLVEKVKQWGLHISSIQSILHTQIALPLHPIHGAGARKKEKDNLMIHMHDTASKILSNTRSITTCVQLSIISANSLSVLQATCTHNGSPQINFPSRR